MFDAFWNSEAAIPIEALSRKPKATIRAVLAQIHDEAGTPEARLYTDFLPARDWV